MRKISIEEVKPGMVIASDLFDPDFGGGDFPLITSGVELTEKFIDKVKARGIYEILIETPPGYRGAPGETLAPTEVAGDILFEGKIELSCDIPPNIKIVAGEDIIIKGVVNQGASLTSAHGNITIEGGVYGADKGRVTISASKKVAISLRRTATLIFSDIKAISDISIEGNVSDCTLSTKGKLIIHGAAKRSKLYSQSRIRLLDSGEIERTPCQLLVKPAECRALFQELMALDKELAAWKKDQERRQNTIDLVQKLGKTIDQVAPEKRAELAADVKKFQETAVEISSGLRRKDRIKDKVLSSLSSHRVFITGKAHPNTIITIENFSSTLQEQAKSVAFYVADMKIANDPIKM